MRETTFRALRRGAGLLLLAAAGCRSAGTPPPAAAGASAQPAQPAPEPGAQRAQTLRRQVTADVELRYLLHLPPGYGARAEERWPLILFLHGAGERGDDLDRVAAHGPPRLARERPELPFIVVSPQVPGDRIWSTTALLALLDEVQARYAVDPDRVYLTGLSMGGYGAWQLAMEHPERFAAFAPVSAGAVPSGACMLRELPTWVFHGALDDVVPLDRATQLVERLRGCAGADVRLTVYADAGHDAWTRTYGDSVLYDWFLHHRRGAPAAAGRAPGARWRKGNTHTHTLWSDGDDFPEMAADWYRRAGYDFVAMTDHNTLTADERWVRVPAGGPLRTALRKYRNRFGDWVEERTRGDTLQVRLRRFAEWRPRVEQAGRFLVLPGEEITQYLDGRGAHMNAIGLTELVPPQEGATLVEMFRRDLALLAEQERRTGREIVAVLNHPNFVWSQTAEDLLQLPELRFFEVYNGHPLVNTLGDSLHASTERIWDIVLTGRAARGEELLLGVATDDVHDWHAFAPHLRNPGRGWVMVRADTLEAGALLAALRRGDFYASTGVVLDDVRRDGSRLSLAIRPEPGVTYTTQFIGTRRGWDTTSTAVTDSTGRPLTRRYSADVGAVLAEVAGTAPSYALRGDELYVRARVVSSKPKGNPSYDGEVEMAWVQPVR